MKYALLLPLLFVSGCTTCVKISDATVTSVDSEKVVVELETEKDLRAYEDSFWAIRVYLRYEPEDLIIETTNSDFRPEAREYVFSVYPTFISEASTDEGLYLSRWEIPRSDYFNWAFTKYSYEIDPTSEIRLRLGGGTMHGTKLRSNKVVIIVPKTKEIILDQ